MSTLRAGGDFARASPHILCGSAISYFALRFMKLSVNWDHGQFMEQWMSQLIDCIFVSTQPFTEPGRRDRSAEECRLFCLEVGYYVRDLLNLGFHEREMPRPLIHVYRVSELVIPTEPCNDILDFFNNIEWSKEIIEETIVSLQEIGADAHVRYLSALNDYLKEVEYSVCQENVDEFCDVIEKSTANYLSSDIMRMRYGNLDVNVNREWKLWLYSICFHAVEYMEGWTNIIRVPDGKRNKEELQKYFESKPEILKRLRQIEEEESRAPRVAKCWGIPIVRNRYV